MTILLRIPDNPTDQQKLQIKQINNFIKLYECKLFTTHNQRIERGWQHIDQLIQKNTDLSVPAICTLNQLVGCKGELRGVIDSPWSENNIAIRGYQGARSKNLPKLMEEYVVWLSSPLQNVEPLLKICGAYLIFALLHPFRDGNGRTGRLIAAWLMRLDQYAVLAPYLEKIWGNENQSHGKTFESGIYHYSAWTHEPFFEAYFMNFFDHFLKDLIEIFHVFDSRNN
jgi:Fic family protein